MKKRIGFVSNSSSSSFICDISGEVVSGRDISLEEAEMYECENGHTFLREYTACEIDDLPMEIKRNLIAGNEVFADYNIADRDEREADLNKRKNIFTEKFTDEEINSAIEDEDYDDDVKNGYNIPAEMCPLCSFSIIADREATLYFFKKYNMTQEILAAEIKGKFKDYNEFLKFLTKKE